MKKTLTILSILLLSGCSFLSPPPPVDRVVYKTTPLTLPVRPILPTWKGADLKCLPDELKKKILDRDVLRKQYIEELEAIINSTR